MLSNKPNGAYMQGTFDVSNKEKYVGSKPPFYRSSYEKRIFFWCDHNKNVIEWSSETLVIPYKFRVDGKMHRYYPDVIAKIKTNDGIKKYIIEVKPLKQTKPPKKPKNSNAKRIKRYNNEMAMYIKNIDKWEATSAFCQKKGYKFKIITETDLFNR